jgi:hypothetical protein
MQERYGTCSAPRGNDDQPTSTVTRAMRVEPHEKWLEDTRYLNMQHLIEHKKEALRQAA